MAPSPIYNQIVRYLQTGFGFALLFDFISYCPMPRWVPRKKRVLDCSTSASNQQPKKENNVIESVLITGANAGLGKETARQFALRQETEKVILFCRNQARAAAAKKELEENTGETDF